MRVYILKGVYIDMENKENGPVLPKGYDNKKEEPKKEEPKKEDSVKSEK